MRQISAIIAPSRFDAVTDALAALGVGGITATQLLGHSLDELDVEVYRGRVSGRNLVPRIRLDLVADDLDADDLVRVIRSAAAPADGHIWVIPVDTLARVRTGERGVDAL